MPRLPITGSDDGAWGDILNEFLGVAHNTDGTLKNVAASNHSHAISDLTDYDNSTPATTGQVIAYNGTTFAPATVADATSSGGVYPLSAYGFVAISGVPESFDSNAGDGGGGYLRVARIWVPAGSLIQGICTYVNSAGTYGGTGWNGAVIYNDAGSQIGVTADTPTLWDTQGWRSVNLISTIPAQSTGRFVRVGILSNGYSGLTFVFAVTSVPSVIIGGHGVSNRRNVFESGHATPPASINPATFGTEAGYLPAIGLY